MMKTGVGVSIINRPTKGLIFQINPFNISLTKKTQKQIILIIPFCKIVLFITAEKLIIKKKMLEF